MKTIIFAPLVFLISLQLTLYATIPEDTFSPSIILAEAEAIDKILKSTYQKRQVKIPAKINEAALVRRLYLSLAGRIPTYQEVNSYLSNTSDKKKSQLIEELTESSGYDSHMFNWWAA